MIAPFNKENNSPLDLLNFSSKKQVPLILQAEMAECGLACMAMISSFHGHNIDMIGIRERYSTGLKGMSLYQLIEVADRMNFVSRAIQCPLKEIGKLSLPCILHWDMNHFIVLTKVNKSKVTINDPIKGKLQLSIKEFSQHYTGIALELSTTKRFEIKDQRQTMKLSQLWSSITGLPKILLTLFSLSFLLQIYALSSPYYLQLVIDEAVISQDQYLLIILAIGFGLLLIINTITIGFRSWIIIRVSSLLNMQMGVNLLRHMLRLPIPYFENRHIGDIISKFDSLGEIRETITTGLVETFVDGVMSISIIIMMLLYSVRLTAVVIFSVSIYSAFRFILYRHFHQVTEESIQAKAKEQTNFIENIRGIQTIKLFTRESQRQNLWQNLYADVINTDIKLGKLNISFEVTNKLIFGLENITVIYLASTMVISGEMTVGMIIAFIAYKKLLTDRVSGLVDQLILFKMLRLHLERISDIALQAHEEDRIGTCIVNEVRGELTLENISFSFNNSTKKIIDNITFTINPMELVAIVGESGCGKTTLMKLMLGILKPTEGRILLDGKDITRIGLLEYRKHIASVMQNDTLFSGTIAENITFFDPSPDFPKMVECAKHASIDVEIEAMTMGYNTHVGNMGNQFSGGQVQRFLIARALYNRPKLLFLDEATSHLDLNNEISISGKIRECKMTRIIVAHRPETIKKADRVITIRSGKLVNSAAESVIDKES